MGSRSRVLVIDDDASIGAVYKMALEIWGFAASVAQGADEALTMIRSSGMPTLIFVDCNMPRLSGEDFLDRFYDFPGEKCPVVGFSAYPKGSPSVQKFEARVDHYIEKPSDLDAFEKVVRRFLESKPISE